MSITTASILAAVSKDPQSAAGIDRGPDYSPGALCTGLGAFRTCVACAAAIIAAPGWGKVESVRMASFATRLPAPWSQAHRSICRYPEGYQQRFDEIELILRDVFTEAGSLV